jgi:hypothetical protein
LGFSATGGLGIPIMYGLVCKCSGIDKVVHVFVHLTTMIKWRIQMKLVDLGKDHRVCGGKRALLLYWGLPGRPYHGCRGVLVLKKPFCI